MSEPRFITAAEVEGQVIPDGGTTNQVLAKNSDADFDLKWTTGGGGNPGGSNTQIQFNDNGAFGGSPLLYWNESANGFVVGDADLGDVFQVNGQNLNYNYGDNSFLVDDQGIHFENFDLKFGAPTGLTIAASDIDLVTGLVPSGGLNAWVFDHGPYIYDSNGNDSIYSDEKQLYDGDKLSLDYGVRQLLGSDGTTVALDWSSGVMALTPMADPPESAVEGMVYADTDHHLYYYNGTDWKQLDNTL